MATAGTIRSREIPREQGGRAKLRHARKMNLQLANMLSRNYGVQGRVARSLEGTLRATGVTLDQRTVVIAGRTQRSAFRKGISFLSPIMASAGFRYGLQLATRTQGAVIGAVTSATLRGGQEVYSWARNKDYQAEQYSRSVSSLDNQHKRSGGKKGLAFVGYAMFGEYYQAKLTERMFAVKSREETINKCLTAVGFTATLDSIDATQIKQQEKYIGMRNREKRVELFTELDKQMKLTGFAQYENREQIAQLVDIVAITLNPKDVAKAMTEARLAVNTRTALRLGGVTLVAGIQGFTRSLAFMQIIDGAKWLANTEVGQKVGEVVGKVGRALFQRLADTGAGQATAQAFEGVTQIARATGEIIRGAWELAANTRFGEIVGNLVRGIQQHVFRIEPTPEVASKAPGRAMMVMDTPTEVLGQPEQLAEQTVETLLENGVDLSGSRIDGIVDILQAQEGNEELITQITQFDAFNWDTLVLQADDDPTLTVPESVAELMTRIDEVLDQFDATNATETITETSSAEPPFTTDEVTGFQGQIDRLRVIIQARLDDTVLQGLLGDGDTQAEAYAQELQEKMTALDAVEETVDDTTSFDHTAAALGGELTTLTDGIDALDPILSQVTAGVPLEQAIGNLSTPQVFDALHWFPHGSQFILNIDGAAHTLDFGAIPYGKGLDYLLINQLGITPTDDIHRRILEQLLDPGYSDYTPPGRLCQ